MSIAFLAVRTAALCAAGSPLPRKEERMIRKFALVSAVVASALSAGSLVAQTAAPAAKPGATSTMQHSQTPPAAKQDTGSKAAAKAAAHHAVWTKEQIEEAQQGLIKAGLYKGQATGTFNADTRKALREYEKQNHLPATGQLSDSVLAKLKTS
jgi:peptidoglycan hydrolase-like protein with peptidoglycan-binding domain